MTDQDLNRVARDIVNGYNAADWKLLKSILTPDGQTLLGNFLRV